jgi:hypothetical protein
MTLWTDNSNYLVSLSVTESEAYWTDGYLNSHLGPLDGGAASPLGGLAATTILLGASGTTLYYCTVQNATSTMPTSVGLFRVSVDGGTAGPPTMLTDAGVSSGAVAVDAVNVYYIIQGDLFACPHNGSPRKLAANVGGGPMVLYESTLYVGGPSILSVPLDGGSPMPVIQNAGTSTMFGLAVDDTHFYWGNAPTGLSRAPRDGGSPEILVANVTVRRGAQTIAVNDGGIYWVVDHGMTPGPLGILAK